MKRWIVLTGMIAAAIWVAGTAPSPCGAEVDYSMLPEQDGTIGKEVNMHELPVGGKGIALTLPDGRRRAAPARVQAILYYGTEWSPASPERSVTRRAWFYYELQSKDPAVPYRWSMWSNEILDRFILFNTPDGKRTELQSKGV